jgi:hypothetical protein
VLITPSAHPKKLFNVYNSINFNQVLDWIIIHNYDKSHLNKTETSFKPLQPLPLRMFRDHPKITELFDSSTDVSKGGFGNAQRNLGLKYVQHMYGNQANSLWLYFLDDDNILHPNLWTFANLYSTLRILFVGQMIPDGTINFSLSCKPGSVDSGMALIGLGLLRESHLKWLELHKRGADGFFLSSVCQTFVDLISKIDCLGSYWNGQACKLERVEIVL